MPGMNALVVIPTSKMLVQIILIQNTVVLPVMLNALELGEHTGIRMKM